jgi:hypothetical protein
MIDDNIELIVPPADYVAPEPLGKGPRLKDIVAAMEAQQEQIAMLAESVQMLVQAGRGSPAGPMAPQSPAISGPDSMNQMLGLMKGFFDLQATMKQSLVADLQLVAELGMGGGDAEPDGLGQLAEAVTPAVQAYIQAKTAGSNSGSVGGGASFAPAPPYAPAKVVLPDE